MELHQKVETAGAGVRARCVFSRTFLGPRGLETLEHGTVGCSTSFRGVRAFVFIFDHALLL